MNELEKRILSDGIALNDHVLKVDSFVNHQVDVKLMEDIGKDFAAHYKDANITKVVTIETSGIAPAVFTALYLNVPLIILKKRASKTLTEDIFQTTITSFTKNISYDLTLSKKYLNDNDNVIIIDDFLANGEAAMGAVTLTKQAGANIEGIGILIEKSFQSGRERLIKAGYDVYSLARISSLSEGKITFIEE